MKPPICSICYNEFSDELEEKKGGLIYFKKRKSDQKWEDEMRKEGFTGHPPYAAWFCKDHYEEAIKLKELPIDEAMAKLKEIFPEEKH